ncbi:GIY-YIG nuclease family protein [Halopseudomonas sp.]|uniref:GIY-YIG nuclease family protein n=1 Tax=Halopseudomonas sp. TaxID=2901191 RepID=UPI00356B2EFC
MPADRPENSPAPAPAQTWWVYMVRAENGHLYTGISTDPLRRFAQHQKGRGARFFNRSPAQALVWTEVCADHTSALRREIAIKALNKLSKERLISQINDSSSTLHSGCAALETPAKLSSP